MTTPIFVWAVVTDERGILLIPAREADGWTLPGGPLLPDDDTVESAILRVLDTRHGIALPDEPEFLVTRYERWPDGRTVVHNLFHLPAGTLASGIEAFGDAVGWLDPAGAGDLGIPAWLAEGLDTLFEDEDGLPPFDLAQVQGGVGQFRPDAAAITPAAPVVILTGPAGVGKSTTARELCLRFDRAAHVDVDTLRGMIVSGYASPVPGESDPAAAAEQIDLAIANAAAIARNVSAAGILAVIDDVLEMPDQLDLYLDHLGPDADVRVITLLTDRAVLARRDAGRPPGQQMGARAGELHHTFMTNGETRGVRLDTSRRSVEESVDIILEQLDEARV